MAILGLKVDVDTYSGMENGVPRILKVLDERGIEASFFISFGPDRSGLAVFQLIRPRFLAKMIHTNATSMYGIKTALYGTLLPAPKIGANFPDLLKQIKGAGHEVACHAWDHRIWQDWLNLMSKKRIEIWFDKMVNSYVDILGVRPFAFGAPGWMMDTRSLDIAKGFGFDYLSCTRASGPFIFEENGMLEIPSNLPCIEEVGTDRVLKELEIKKDENIPQILPVHTEVEGGIYLDDFKRILDKAQRHNYKILRLTDIAGSLDNAALEIKRLNLGILPGRALKCAL